MWKELKTFVYNFLQNSKAMFHSQQFPAQSCLVLNRDIKDFKSLFVNLMVQFYFYVETLRLIGPDWRVHYHASQIVEINTNQLN